MVDQDLSDCLFRQVFWGLPWTVVSQDCIEDCQELSGDGTPEVLKTYLENFDSRIIGLTGDAAKTEAIAKAFRVFAKKVPGEKAGDYTVDHNGILYLMRGRFVSAFNLSRPPQQAARELERYL